MTIADLMTGSAAGLHRQFQIALDPVRDTQATFRVVLNALSWPGSVWRLPTAAAGAPANAWAAAVLITLLDHETTLATEALPALAELATFVRQRTSHSPAALDRADFVLVSGEGADATLPGSVALGSLSYPEESATVIVLVPSLDPAAGGLQLGLAGPGVPPGLTAQVAGIPQAFWLARTAVVSAYPCGFDLVLIDDEGRIAAFPRTTAITPTPEEA